MVLFSCCLIILLCEPFCICIMKREINFCELLEVVLDCVLMYKPLDSMLVECFAMTEGTIWCRLI